MMPNASRAWHSMTRAQVTAPGPDAVGADTPRAAPRDSLPSHVGYGTFAEGLLLDEDDVEDVHGEADAIVEVLHNAAQRHLGLAANQQQVILGVTAIVVTIVGRGSIGTQALAMALPNLLLVAIYGCIAFYIARTQIHNRRPLGGWSLSGLSLAVIFPTCAAMHGVFAFYALSGMYARDTHHLVIDWLSVPAGLYFLYVVRSLYRGNATDWNRMRAPRAASAPEPATTATPATTREAIAEPVVSGRV